jgi:hypothetical protein
MSFNNEFQTNLILKNIKLFELSRFPMIYLFTKGMITKLFKFITRVFL